MNETHDQIEELLAGYALRALSRPDAEEAERLLTEHVPGCARCRETLADFQAVAGELALAAPAAAPPDLLEARIERDADDGHPPAVRHRSTGRRAAAAAAALVMVGLGGWNALLTQRVNRAESFQAAMTNAVFTANDPRSENVPLDDDGQDATDIYLVYVPGQDRMYLLGKDVPRPARGHLYWVWLGRDQQWEAVRWFVPRDGLVALEMTGSPEGYQAIWICQEREGEVGSDPSEPIWVAEV